MYKNMNRIKGDKFPCGYINIPYGHDFIISFGNFIVYKDGNALKPICLESSEFAYTNFAYNEDGNADKRFKLINDSISIMTNIVDKNRYFAELFTDNIARKYKKDLDPNTWLWNRLAVHKAPIEDLEYLHNLFTDMLIRCKKDMPEVYDRKGRPRLD